MRTLVHRFVLVLFFAGLFFPPAIVHAAKGGNRRSAGCVVLATRHKFKPPCREAVARGGNRNGLVVRLTGARRSKNRPAFRSRLLSPAVLARKLSSKSVMVMDADTGAVLYARNPEVPRQPASTIKVLTGLIALNSLNHSARVTTSRRAASMPRSKVYLQRGRSYEANDLINAVLLASANDASVALAEKIAGSERVFARLMTKKARSFGARNTVCKTATGLTARGQHSTARDLAVIFNHAMEDGAFATKIARVKVGTRFGKVLRNHNRALWQVVGAEGGKTGYTRAARQTYVGKFRRGDSELLVALMGSETMWSDINLLVDYGFARKRRMRAVAGRAAAPAVSMVAGLGRPAALSSLRILSDRKKFSRL